MIDDLGNVCCDRCGLMLEIGDHPFCPHGRGASAITRDEIPGGVICENYGPHPIRFDSHSERRKYMETHSLKEKEKFSPTPGTDIDPAGIPNPAGYLDPYTLESAAALICRNGRSSAEPFNPDSVMKITAGHMSDQEAIRASLTGER